MSNKNCRILCVDDHHDTAEMLQLLLSDEQYEVHTAGSFEEACSLSMSNKYDLYVLDKRLPDGSGLELCETLSRITPGIPCIFYSGDAYQIHRSEALEAGATAYVAKPDIDALVNVVNQVLTDRECATSASSS